MLNLHSQKNVINPINLPSPATWDGPQLLLAKVKSAFGRIGIFTLIIWYRFYWGLTLKTLPEKQTMLEIIRDGLCSYSGSDIPTLKMNI